MYSKAFIDTNNPYVEQGYDERDWFPGSYRIEYEGSAGDRFERMVTLEDGLALRVDINCP